MIARETLQVQREADNRSFILTETDRRIDTLSQLHQERTKTLLLTSELETVQRQRLTDECAVQTVTQSVSEITPPIVHTSDTIVMTSQQQDEMTCSQIVDLLDRTFETAPVGQTDNTTIKLPTKSLTAAHNSISAEINADRKNTALTPQTAEINLPLQHTSTEINPTEATALHADSQTALFSQHFAENSTMHDRNKLMHLAAAKSTDNSKNNYFPFENTAADNTDQYNFAASPGQFAVAMQQGNTPATSYRPLPMHASTNADRHVQPVTHAAAAVPEQARPPDMTSHATADHYWSAYTHYANTGLHD